MVYFIVKIIKSILFYWYILKFQTYETNFELFLRIFLQTRPWFKKVAKTIIICLRILSFIYRQFYDCDVSLMVNYYTTRTCRNQKCVSIQLFISKRNVEEDKEKEKYRSIRTFKSFVINLEEYQEKIPLRTFLEFVIT